jgi:hypothetical protein
MYYIAETGNGKTTLVSYFKALQKGLDPDEAFAGTFGKLDLGKFERDWKGFTRGVK